MIHQLITMPPYMLYSDFCYDDSSLYRRNEHSRGFGLTNIYYAENNENSSNSCYIRSCFENSEIIL